MKKGFTLIEILVSVALFTMVMVVALGALLSLSVAARKAEGINSAINNLGSAFDSMTRAIRTGANYYCGDGDEASGKLTNDCSSGSIFSVLTQSGQVATYCLGSLVSGAWTCNSGSTVTCGGTSCSILRDICTGANCSGFVQLTAPDVDVSYLSFGVKGSPQGDNIQPLVTITLNGTVQVTATQSTPFNLQTSVAERVLFNL